MPKMKLFLESNSPWDQLIDLNNIHLTEIFNNENITISNNIEIVPFTVPHRDEFSETVGYKIIGPNKSALFIPDINKWNLWDKDIVQEVKDVDYAFLDATFLTSCTMSLSHRFHLLISGINKADLLGPIILYPTVSENSSL